MEENPFESLARGLDRGSSALLEGAKPDQSNRALLISVAPVFGMSNVPVGSGTGHPKPFGEQPLQSLTDTFVEQIAVFPVTKHVVINKFGAYVPQSLFGLETEIAYRKVSNPDGSINITIHPKQSATPLDEFLQKDDPIYDIGKDPVSCGASDASENLDQYIYGGE